MSAPRAATIGAVLLFIGACSRGPDTGAPPPPPPPTANTCAGFAVALYPSVTSSFCETTPAREGNPEHSTAYLKSNDGVAQVARYYRTQVAGWTAKPDEGDTADHAVVVITREKAYASIVANAAGSGSSIQVVVYPNGN